MKHLLLLGLISSAAFAQDTLEVIEVNANKEAEAPPLWEEQDKTKILTGKKNRTSKINYLPPVQTDNLRQHFSQQPGIYTPEFSTEPWTSMNFRGLGNPHEGQELLILLDGIPVSIDMYGQPGNYYSPPAPLMEELQVIAGGGALMYGPQASAAVNYLTPALSKGMANSGKFNLSGGSYNLFSTVNSIKGSSGNTSYWMGYFRKQGDGYQRENADFRADNFHAKAHTFLEGNAILKFGLQAFDSDYGMPGTMTLEEGTGLNTWDEDGGNRKATKKHDRLKIARAQVSVGLEKKVSAQTTLDSQIWFSGYKRYNKTQGGSTFGSFPTGAASETNTINDIKAYGFNGEVRIKHDYELKDHNHSLSVGYLNYNTNSPTHGQQGSAPDSSSGETTGRSLRQTRVNALFAENRFNFGKLSVVPGVRYENIHLSNENRIEDVERSDNYNVLLGGLGLSYFLTTQTQAFANISQGFKPVSYGTVFSQGNPNTVVKGDIKPSYNNFYELGLRGETKKINWDLSGYLIQRQNIISSVNLGAITEISNGGAAEYKGIETALTLKNVMSSSGSGETDLYFNANYQNAKFTHGSRSGKTPSYVPSVLLKYGLIFRKEDRLKASLLGTFVNEHFASDDHADNTKIPSYMLYDLLAEYNLNKAWSINGAINNLLDEQYYARIQGGIVPTMGRNMYAGVNYRF